LNVDINHIGVREMTRPLTHAFAAVIAIAISFALLAPAAIVPPARAQHITLA
jgi:hypothetical protein